MANTPKNGKAKKTLQSSISNEEYTKFQKRLAQLSKQQKIEITESAYIRKLILEDTEKGDSS
jgi:hypothetical protein